MPKSEFDHKLQSIISELHTLLEQRNFQLAIKQLDAVPAAYADKPEVNTIRFWIFYGAGKFKEATEVLDKIKDTDAPEAQILGMQSHLQHNSDDVNALEITAKRLRILQPDDGTVYTKLALAHMRKNNIIAAAKAARSAIEIDPTIPGAHKVLYMAALEAGNHTRIQEVLYDAVASGTDYPHFPEIRITMLAMPKATAEKLQKAMAERWPKHISSEINPTLSVSKYTKVEDVIKQAYTLKLQGKNDQVQDLIQPYYDSPETNRLQDIRIKLDVVKNIPGPEQRKRALINDIGAEITCSPVCETGVTVLFFTGLMDGAMVDITVFDAFCAQAGYSAIYLRDFSRNLFISGLESSKGDQDKMLLVIKQQLAALGTKRLISIGASAGGFAALSCGKKLNADHTICFSAPTSMTKEGMEKFGDTRGQILLRRLHNTFKPEDLDVGPQLTNAGRPMPIDLYCGQGNTVDCAHAQYISDLPNVTFHPIPDLSDHSCIHYLIATGQLPDILTK